MKLSTLGYKGTRDFYPEDMRIRNYMFGTMRQVCQSFGYEEYDTPILESIDLYTAKTSEEIVNEQTYSFDDRGGRRVVMRPEMTPSVSRLVASRRQELGYPLRLFSIPNCFRYERPQRGRLREFWQLNADVFGIESIDADVEIIQLADAIMKRFGATDEMYEIRVNSRQLLKKRVNEAGIKTSANEVIRLIDMFEKLDQTAFVDKLAGHVEKPDALYGFLSSDGDSLEVKDLIMQLESRGVRGVSSPSLARGFDYYTDIVFEVFDKNPDNNRSMFGGGRYDGLVGAFGVEPVPTVGFGMGDVTLQNFLETWNLVPDKLRPATDVVVASVGDVDVSAVVQALREQGINVATDTTPRKLDKKIKSADKLGIRYIMMVGDNEVSSGTYVLRDIVDSKDITGQIDTIASILVDR